MFNSTKTYRLRPTQKLGSCACASTEHNFTPTPTFRRWDNLCHHLRTSSSSSSTSSLLQHDSTHPSRKQTTFDPLMISSHSLHNRPANSISLMHSAAPSAETVESSLVPIPERHRVIRSCSIASEIGLLI